MANLRIGIIGYGAIGREIVEYLTTGSLESAKVIAVLVRNLDRYYDFVAAMNLSGILLTNNADAFFNCHPDLVVEVAGQEAVATYASRAIKSGADFLVTSIGAFTDDDLYHDVVELAKHSMRNLYLVAGALPGVDWMLGASRAKVDSVKITQTKPVASWMGTPADAMIDLTAIQAPTPFFTGSARQAASIFKKSSNITAMLALATIGLDRVIVTLVADPFVVSMHTLVEFIGVAGELTLQWQGVPSTLNPSTSMDVPLNVAKAIENICSPVKLGV